MRDESEWQKTGQFQNQKKTQKQNASSPVSPRKRRAGSVVACAPDAVIYEIAAYDEVKALRLDVDDDVDWEEEADANAVSELIPLPPLFAGGILHAQIHTEIQLIIHQSKYHRQERKDAQKSIHTKRPWSHHSVDWLSNWAWLPTIQSKNGNFIVINVFIRSFKHSFIGKKKKFQTYFRANGFIDPRNSSENDFLQLFQIFRIKIAQHFHILHRQNMRTQSVCVTWCTNWETPTRDNNADHTQKKTAAH